MCSILWLHSFLLYFLYLTDPQWRVSDSLGTRLDAGGRGWHDIPQLFFDEQEQDCRILISLTSALFGIKILHCPSALKTETALKSTFFLLSVSSSSQGPEKTNTPFPLLWMHISFSQIPFCVLLGKTFLLIDFCTSCSPSPVFYWSVPVPLSAF